MTTLPTATRQPDRLPLDPAGRAACRRLACENARHLVDPPGWDTLPDAALAAWARLARPALRSLLHELDVMTGPDLARLALADARRRPVLCPGSGTFVPVDVVDDAWLATCPSCYRPRRTTDVDGNGRWLALDPHRARP